jgi:hypothetical protein
VSRGRRGTRASTCGPAAAGTEAGGRRASGYKIHKSSPKQGRTCLFQQFGQPSVARDLLVERRRNTRDPPLLAERSHDDTGRVKIVPVDAGHA